MLIARHRTVSAGTYGVYRAKKYENIVELAAGVVPNPKPNPFAIKIRGENAQGINERWG